MPIRLGFLGAGLVARIHSRSLAAVDGRITWSGVFDPDRGRAGTFSAETGAVVCRTEGEVLDRSEAVYICSWTSEHPRLVRAAADAGLAIFCEKPLATSLALAGEMTRRVDQAGVVNQAGLVLRHSPAFRWMRRLLHARRAAT